MTGERRSWVHFQGHLRPGCVLKVRCGKGLQTGRPEAQVFEKAVEGVEEL